MATITADTAVQTTASGLMYKVITEGSGAKPTVSDTVTVNYEGRLLDGTVFDSSYARNQPATFALTGVIAGWTEALQLMPVGSKYTLYVPPELGYGSVRRMDRFRQTRRWSLTWNCCRSSKMG